MPRRAVALQAGAFVAVFIGWMSLLWLCSPLDVSLSGRGRLYSTLTWLPIIGFVAAIPGLGAVFLTQALLEKAVAVRQAAAVDREERGLPLRDGEIEAASGPVVARDGLLLAPLSGRPCVAWTLEEGFVYTSKYRRNRETKDWIVTGWGRGVANGTIVSARGEVLLLGWPDLEGLDHQVIPGSQVRLHLAGVLAEWGPGLFADVSAEPDGTDALEQWSLDPRTLEEATLAARERIVESNHEVTALGIWSARRGGLLGSPGASGRHVRIVPGRGAAVRSHLSGESSRGVRNALIAFLVMNLTAIFIQAALDPSGSLLVKLVDGLAVLSGRLAAHF
ncbi:MAG TPA: hypothetical protein VE129_17745 [Thermoanaerobaculia bacterium]|nr:hypothetical protein [Thermoanaerobaculia bacterium]